MGFIVEKFVNNLIFKTDFYFEKFNFFFSYDNYCFIDESLIFFFDIQVDFLFYFILYKFAFYIL